MLRDPGLVNRIVYFPCLPLTASVDNIVYRGEGGVEEQGVAYVRPSTVCPEKFEGAQDYIPPALRNAGRGPSRSAAAGA